MNRIESSFLFLHGFPFPPVRRCDAHDISISITAACSMGDRRGHNGQDAAAAATANAADQAAEYCYMKVSIAGQPPSHPIVFRLDTRTCPRTCRNFASLCSASSETARRPPKTNTSMTTSMAAYTSAKTTTNPQTYRGTEFHRIKPGFMVQGGDYENYDGTGGRSIYHTNPAGTFADESYVNTHNAEGVLSMANRGKNTNGSQFFITLASVPHLNGKHVAFGQVVRGMDVVKEIAAVEVDERDRPIALQRVVVVDCGVGMGMGAEDDGVGGNANGKDERRGRNTRDKTRDDDARQHKHKRKKKRRREHRSVSSSSSCSSSSFSSDSSSSESSYARKRRKRRHDGDDRDRGRKSRHEDKSKRSRSSDREDRRKKKKEKKKSSKKHSRSKSSRRDRHSRSRKHRSRSRSR